MAYLKSELGLQRDARKQDVLKRAFGTMPKEAAILLMLYEAYPRTVMRYQLERATLSYDSDEDRLYPANLVSVYMTKLRKKLGREAISTVWEQGYALTSVGHAAVSGAFT